MAVPHITFVVLLAATVLIGFPGGWKNLGAWNIFAAYEGVNAVAKDVVDGTTCNTSGFVYRLIGGSGAAYVAPIAVGAWFGMHFGPYGMAALGTGGFYVGSKLSGFLAPSCEKKIEEKVERPVEKKPEKLELAKILPFIAAIAAFVFVPHPFSPFVAFIGTALWLTW